jgi:hypothetical protein
VNPIGLTPEDFQVVAAAHGATLSDDLARELFAELADKVSDGWDNYTDLADQVAGARSEIEDELFDLGLIAGSKQFVVSG